MLLDSQAVWKVEAEAETMVVVLSVEVREVTPTAGRVVVVMNDKLSVVVVDIRVWVAVLIWVDVGLTILALVLMNSTTPAQETVVG